MSGLFVLLLQIGFWWFLIRLIRAAVNKSKQAANEQKKPGSAPSAPAAPSASRPAAAPQRPVAPQKPAAPAAKERTAPSPRLQQDDYARRTAPVTPRTKTVIMEGSPEPHVVAPSFGRKHAHTESSMTGFDDSPLEEAHAPAAAETETLEPSELTFAGKEIIKAMLYSEILSKPKALR